MFLTLCIAAAGATAPVDVAEAFQAAVVRGYATVATEQIDVFEMSRRVLGARAERFSEVQLQRLAVLLAQTVRLSVLRADRPNVRSICKESHRRDDFVEVHCVWTMSDEDVDVWFRLRRHSDWKIYDIEADGVSFIRDNGSQAARALQRLGPERFLDRLARRVRFQKTKLATQRALAENTK